MPWCPNCKTEYEDGYKNCSDCNSLLVPELPIEQYVDDEEVFLTTLGSNIDADILETLLKSNGIPVMRKYRGTGGYLTIYMGVSSTGVDLFVPSKLYQDAKALLTENPIEKVEISDNVSTEEDLMSEENQYVQKRSRRAWLLLLFLISGSLIGIILLVSFVWGYLF